MAATIWKGQIEFGKVRVPVRFYSAVEDRSVHFNLLHEHDHVRVRQVMVNAQTGEPAAKERVRRGVDVGDGNLVIVRDDELEGLIPGDSRSVRIEQFVPNEQINHQWYERPYVLGPDGQNEEYFALAAALGEGRLEGLARWVMRKKHYLGSLQVSRGYLMMVTLRAADEVIPVASLPKPAGRALDKKELALAKQLIDGLHGKFDPSQYRNEYQNRLMAFIEAKSKGRRPKLRIVRPPRVTRQDNLTSVLSASLRSLRKGA